MSDPHIDQVLDCQCCESGTGRCELATIAASQLSTALILLVYVIVRIYEVASAAPDNTLSIQTTTASVVTIVYIFLSFLLVENLKIGDLRLLRPPFAVVEFIFRVTLLVVIALMPTFVEHWLPSFIGYVLTAVGRAPDSLFGPSDYVVMFLGLLYLMFLLWDAIVYFGAPPRDEAKKEIRATPREFFGRDVTGLVILSLVEAVRFVSPALASFAIIVFILYSGWLISSVYRDLRDQFRPLTFRGILR